MNRPKFEDYRWKYTVSLKYDVSNYASDMKIYCDKLEKTNKELVDYRDKYRWHNLKKNPEDLPALNSIVIFAHSGLGEKIGYNLVKFDKYYIITSSELAWRYNDNFEDN